MTNNAEKEKMSSILSAVTGVEAEKKVQTDNMEREKRLSIISAATGDGKKEKIQAIIANFQGADANKHLPEHHPDQVGGKWGILKFMFSPVSEQPTERRKPQSRLSKILLGKRVELGDGIRITHRHGLKWNEDIDTSHVKWSTEAEKAERIEAFKKQREEIEEQFLNLDNTKKVEIPPSFWEKLDPGEKEFYVNKVIPKYGNLLTEMEREMLRKPADSDNIISIKDGKFYTQAAVDRTILARLRAQGQDTTYILTPKLMTHRQIRAELKSRAESDRVLKVYGGPWIGMPEWEFTGETIEEFHARRINEDRKFKRTHAPSIQEWDKRLEKELGRVPRPHELRMFLAEYETWEQQHEREMGEYLQLERYKSSFGDPLMRFYDRDVNRILRRLIFLGFIWHYGWPFVIGCISLVLFGAFLVIYLRIRDDFRSCKRPFADNPRSPWSTARQFELWKIDREYWRSWGVNIPRDEDGN